ncbi:MAG TPA: FliH/SctL family protein [Azospirillum sp.]|nr:FliH/SctL family protein [Azospirillum sp.]
MTSVRKFLFDESFDVDLHGHGYARAEEVETLPPPPAFGAEELAAAREAGFQEGVVTGREAGFIQGSAEGHAAGLAEGTAQGRAEMEASVAALTASALDRIAAGVETLIAEREATNAARRDQPAHIALAIVRKLMPELARRGGLAEIEAMVRSCLTELIDEPRLVVRVADDTLELVREQLEGIASRGFDAKLTIVGDATLGPGDCRIEWAEGGTERDTGRLLADIEQCAARLLEAPAPQCQ